jgi:hypothetical protein
MSYPHARAVVSLATCIFSLFIESAGRAQSSFAWAARMGGGYTGDFANSVAIDPEGSSIVTGFFYNQCDFGVTNFSAAHPGYPETFVAKYDKTGNLLWARSSGFFYADTPRAVAVDSHGNSFVVGNFSNGGSFGSTNLSSVSGSDDIFIAKFTADGRQLWVLQIGGNSTDYATAVAVDSGGNFYVSGYFFATVDFGGVTVSATANADGFLAKYNNDGQLLWVRTVTGNSSEVISSVSVDQSGNAYIAGYFPNTVMVGATCLFSSGGNDIFIARFNPDGNVIWAKQAGGNGDDSATSVAVDRMGNCFLTGYFAGTATFDSTNLTSSAYDAFIAKYNSTGTVEWARRAGAGNNDYGRGIAVDTNGNAFVTGQFYNSIDFGNTNFSPNLSDDIFVARYDANGNVGWAVAAGGGNGSESGYGIAVDDVGNCVVVGQFTAGANFGSIYLYGLGGTSDGFVLKLLRDLPIMGLQPTNTVVMEHSFVTLSAAAGGTGPLHYQWQFNGNDIPNATNSILQKANVGTNDSGLYRLFVSNYEGAIASTPVTLTILTLSGAVNAEGLQWISGGDLPWFNQTNFTHDGISAAKSGSITNNQQSWIETSISGPARVSFFWKVSSENGYDVLTFSVNDVVQTNISGKIDWKQLSFLVPPGVQTLRWTYTKDESESVGQDSGWLDQVEVVYTPAFSTHPQSVTNVVGTDLTLVSTVTGTPPVTFQWYRDGVPVSGATGSILAINNLQPGQAGGYRLVASNSAGSATSEVAVVTVLIPPHIVTQPASIGGGFGEPVVFSVGAAGQGLLSYQWRLNGREISGATNASFVVPSPSSTNVGIYDVVISSATGTTVSGPARLTLVEMVKLPVVVLEGPVGSNYRVEYKSNVEDVVWTTLQNLTLANSPFYFLDVSGRGLPQRFYRVVPIE